ncbi:MAG TPA: hypothetical protein VJ872_15160 [Nocardioides sp.]|nr:hypothetical protein [Nocardioides sp.]
MSIEEPLTPALSRVLRRAVVEHAASMTRRTCPSVLHVGIPGGAQRTLELDPDWDLDATLRMDMIEAITRRPLAEGRVPLLWLTRAGQGRPTSDDQRWAAAVRAAGAELKVALDLVVVTRHSWCDPRTGVGRTWQRHRHLPAPEQA